MTERIAAHYVGAGFVAGLPKRDLTEDEVEAAGGVRAVVSTGLYVPARNAGDDVFDDLTIIPGVGRVTESLLNNAGVRSFAALAGAEVDDLAVAANVSRERAATLIMYARNYVATTSRKD